MNKITKFLLIIFFILLGTYLLLNGFIKENENIADKVGVKLGGGELSVTQYYTLAQCIETYKNYLQKEDYETAYTMLSPIYKRYVSFEDYKNKVSLKEPSQMQIEDINIITSTTFDVLINESGEKEHYSLLIDSETTTFALFPESFLDYKVTNIKESKKNLSCILKDYIVNIDKCTLNFEIENKSKKEEATIVKSTLFTNMQDELENEDFITILPGETKNISISFETDYTFPSKVVLQRKVDGKDTNIEYSFEID